MPRSLPPLTPDEVESILLSQGFFLDRRRGSHHIYVGSWNGIKRSVPVDKGLPIYNDPKMIKYLLIESGMSREEFHGATAKTAKKIGLRK